MKKLICCLGGLMAAAIVSVTALTQEVEPELNMREIMLSVIAPMTNKLWAANGIRTDSQWQELEQAAMTVIAAGSLIADGGPDGMYRVQAQHADWQAWNRDMMVAARQAVRAIQNHDEAALFDIGNDALYPPCESCHAVYLPR